MLRKHIRRKVSLNVRHQLVQIYLHMGAEESQIMSVAYGLHRRYAENQTFELGYGLHHGKRRSNEGGPKKECSRVNHNDPRWARARAAGTVVA